MEGTLLLEDLFLFVTPIGTDKYKTQTPSMIGLFFCTGHSTAAVRSRISGVRLQPQPCHPSHSSTHIPKTVFMMSTTPLQLRPLQIEKGVVLSEDDASVRGCRAVKSPVVSIPIFQHMLLSVLSATAPSRHLPHPRDAWGVILFYSRERFERREKRAIPSITTSTPYPTAVRPRQSSILPSARRA